MDHAFGVDSSDEESFNKFVSDMNSFDYDISEKFINEYFQNEKNVCLSPLSINQCLSLAVVCANGDTRQELLNALGIDYASMKKHIRNYFNSLYREYFGENKKLESALYLTNSIWFDDEEELKDDCLDELRDNHYCYSYEVDFNGDTDGANKALKEFIKKQTKGLINPTMNLKPTTKLVLMNTLYLKDIWNEMGEDLSLASEKYKFTNLNGQQSSKRLLQGYYAEGRTMKTEDFSAFRTFTHHGYKLTFIKPNDGKQLKNIFTKDNIQYVLNNKNYVFRDDEKKEAYFTNCVFPEYKAECDEDIKSLMNSAYGIEKLFTDNCDFSNVTDTHVYCDKIQHIAKLNVEKKGIEGAAVTYMAMPGKAGPEPETYKEIYETFVVDKEFGFVLTNSRNTVLFSGTVTNID